MEAGGEILGRELAEEQKDHPEDQENTGCDIDIRTDVGEGTGEDWKGSVGSILPVGARRDAFI